MYMDTEFTPYEKQYMAVIEKLKNTFLKKNHDYGSSVKKNYDKFESYGKNEGLKYVFGRIAEKHDRLENLIYGDHPNQVIDESIEDTLLDMANYAILAAVSLQEHKVDAKPTSVIEQFASIGRDEFFQVKNSIPVEAKPIRLKKDDLGLDEKPYNSQLKRDEFYKGENPPYYGG